MIPQQVLNSIHEGKTFILTTHINPDADGVGSCVALQRLLLALGKKSFIINEGRLSKPHSFIEETVHIQTAVSPEAEVADTWIVLDTSRYERTGTVKLRAGRKLVVIDHHGDNPAYGDVNWINGNSAATVEMIYELFTELGVVPDAISASALYSGLLVDTGGFRFSNTTANTLSIAAKLIEYGAQPHELYRRIFLDKEMSRILIEAKMYSSMQIYFGGALCVMQISLSDMVESGARESDLEGLSNYTLSIKGVEVGILLIEQKEKTKVCFRSYGGVNVRNMASRFDGGGHEAASGCTIVADINKAREMVLSVAAGIFN